jgi:hypothetical protein
MSLKSQNIKERWFAAIGGANGESEKVLRAFMSGVQAAGIPEIETGSQRVSVGLGSKLKGMFGGGASQDRNMIVIMNKSLPGWLIYAGARDYGKQLLVSWYLVTDEKKTSRFSRTIGTMASMELDIFKTEELSAFVTIVHQSLKDAVKQVMTEMNLDFTKVDTHTRGFLNIS